MANNKGIPTMLRAYKEDYGGWVEDTARAIEDGRFSEIDYVALADEVRGLGKSERRELKSALEVLPMHMLKARYPPKKHTRSWGLTMRVQWNHSARYLKRESESGARDARIHCRRLRQRTPNVADETGLEVDAFPESCEWPCRFTIIDIRQWDAESLLKSNHPCPCRSLDSRAPCWPTRNSSPHLAAHC